MIQSAQISALSASFPGRYELIEEVGEGAFGSVYKAKQLTTGQPVAIKVLRIPQDHTADQLDRLTARFRREMRLCAKLQHPNIVRLFDSGKADGPIIYAVFEFVPGKNLGTVLAAERCLAPVEACRLMGQILDALACAHAQGVVHRDLKPENVMVSATGARRNAIVLDFGIGGLTEEKRHDDTRITRNDEWVGTPYYASPEQLRGKPPLPQSDLYTWGLVFLECLTGVRPIRSVHLADVVLEQIAPEPIPIPDSIVDHPLGRLLRRATEKNPAKRDVTAEGLLRELDDIDARGLRLDDIPPRSHASSAFEPTMTMQPQIQ